MNKIYTKKIELQRKQKIFWPCKNIREIAWYNDLVVH